MFTDTLQTFISHRSVRTITHTLGAGLCSLLLAPAVWSASLAIWSLLIAYKAPEEKQD